MFNKTYPNFFNLQSILFEILVNVTKDNKARFLPSF